MEPDFIRFKQAIDHAFPTESDDKLANIAREYAEVIADNKRRKRTAKSLWNAEFPIWGQW